MQEYRAGGSVAWKSGGGGGLWQGLITNDNHLTVDRKDLQGSLGVCNGL